MLEEILVNLKKRYPDLECWTGGLKEESFEDSTLTISVPSQYHIAKYENGYKNIMEKIASKMLGRRIHVQLELQSETEIIRQIGAEAKTDISKFKKFDSNPNFRDKTEVEEYIEYTQRDKGASVTMSVTESKPMSNPYNVEKVASFITFQNEFFTYPTDKRKKAKVKIKIKFSNGECGIYDLFRGQSIVEDEGYGQLNTTHAKVLLAITHIWQEQGCKFADAKGYFAVAKFNIRQLCKKLGFKYVSGTDYIRLFKQLEELASTPNILSCQNKSLSFSLLSSLTIDRDKEKKMSRITISAVFSPFVSKELYERKAFYRESQCYRLQNPTAIKFLLTYERAIIKGNRVAKNIKDMAEDMQIGGVVRSDNLITVIKRAAKELNGYKLNDKYSLKVDIKRLGKSYIVVAERALNTQAYHNNLIMA